MRSRQDSDSVGPSGNWRHRQLQWSVLTRMTLPLKAAICKFYTPLLIPSSDFHSQFRFPFLVQISIPSSDFHSQFRFLFPVQIPIPSLDSHSQLQGAHCYGLLGGNLLQQLLYCL